LHFPNRREFLWLQEADASKDDAIVSRFNSIVNGDEDDGSDANADIGAGLGALLRTFAAALVATFCPSQRCRPTNRALFSISPSPGDINPHEQAALLQVCAASAQKPFMRLVRPSRPHHVTRPLSFFKILFFCDRCCRRRALLAATSSRKYRPCRASHIYLVAPLSKSTIHATVERHPVLFASLLASISAAEQSHPAEAAVFTPAATQPPHLGPDAPRRPAGRASSGTPILDQQMMQNVLSGLAQEGE
jgi:hypothetical protein